LVQELNLGESKEGFSKKVDAFWGQKEKILKRKSKSKDGVKF